MKAINGTTANLEALPKESQVIPKEESAKGPEEASPEITEAMQNNTGPAAGMTFRKAWPNSTV